MAASVWMALMVTSSMVSSRSVAEMMPAVTEPCTLPIGLPMATASSPISSWSLSPKTAGVRPSASILSTAMSLLSEEATSVAS